ncbi:MAG: hypothetical protein HY927_02080 [Elusimicrobia bacterium]|nr:hypothetical protein [Elusimicrobiota bacterium]
MIDTATGELSFNDGEVRFGPGATPESLQALPVAVGSAPGPDLVRFMTTRVIQGLRSGPGTFSAHLDFLRSTLTSVRLMAKGPLWPPDLTDWSLEREMARHDFHCLWVRRQLGWLWRLRRYPWGRVQALCGRNLDKTPRESIVKVVYVEFADIEDAISREFTT